MFCSFEGVPRILRLYGKAKAVQVRHCSHFLRRGFGRAGVLAGPVKVGWAGEPCVPSLAHARGLGFWVLFCYCVNAVVGSPVLWQERAVLLVLCARGHRRFLLALQLD